MICKGKILSLNFWALWTYPGGEDSPCWPFSVPPCSPCGNPCMPSLCAVAEDGIFHTNCGKGCEQARHLQINPLIQIKLYGQAQFLGRLDLYTAKAPQTVAQRGATAICGIVPSSGRILLYTVQVTLWTSPCAFFTNFVEKIVSNALASYQSC